MRQMVRLVTAISLLGFLACTPALAQISSKADEDAIRKLITAYRDAKRVGDAHAQAILYTEDGDEWGVAKKMATGRLEVEAQMSTARRPEFRLEITSLQFVTADIALVDTLYSGASSPPEPVGHAFYLVVRRAGRWLIRSARISPFPMSR